MGFKCRLLGHAYGNPEVERSREEQGDEVVVTVRNVKTCERCGDKQMINQTREVTSVRSPEEVGLGSASSPPDAAQSAGDSEERAEAAGDDSPVTPVEPAAAGTAAPSSTPDAEPVDANADDDPAPEEPTVEPAADQPDAAVAAGSADDGWETGSDEWDDLDADPDIDDAVILDAEETEHDTVQWPEDSGPEGVAPEAAGSPGEEQGATDPDEVDADPTGDAEIIDAGRGSTDAADAADSSDGPDSEWPDDGETGIEAGGWPDHDGPDEGYSATPTDGVEAEFGGDGLTPDVNGSVDADEPGTDGVAVAPSDASAEGTYATDADAASEAGPDADHEGFVRAASSEPSGSDAPDDRVEFYCPGCGYAQAAGRSSLRAGDICPECKRGYIAERET